MKTLGPALAAFLLASALAVAGSLPSSPLPTSASTPAPLGEAPQRDLFGGAYTRKPLGIPAADSVRFFPAIVAAASARNLTAHSIGDEVLVTAGKDTIRYRKDGGAIELWITLKTKGLSDEQLRVRNGELLALHDDLLAAATQVAATASAFSVPATGKAPPETAQARCTYGTDCGFGTFCRDRGDGVKLCMGKGATGDYCTVGTDCGFGTFCRERGDGFKACMGNGRRGDVCAVGTDCGPGLFCRDGESVKTCR